MMGSNDGEDDEKPVHRVELDGFCMDVTEVTVEAYGGCVRAGRCTEPDTGGGCNWGETGRGNHPVNCVDWEQARAYCEWAGKRLPTEAQWEYAARGGSRQREYPWGSGSPEGRACWKRLEGTCPVGSYPGWDSPDGLKDMAGKAWEWVQDWYGRYSSSYDSEIYRTIIRLDPLTRGGGWLGGNPSIRRGSYRYHYTPDFLLYNLGFRCARTRWEYWRDYCRTQMSSQPPTLKR